MAATSRAGGEAKPSGRIDAAEVGDVDSVIDRALAEDLAAGDVTARATVGVHVQASAEIRAKQTLVLGGLEVAARVFARVDPSVRVALEASDGDRVDAGTVVLRATGAARSLLAAERTALNLLQRMCGVATQTAAYVAAAGPGLRVVDTRKTMPGLRALDRYAVRCGGAHNHRNDLGAAVLIKENHIRCAGGVAEAVEAARRHAPHTMKIECEVTNLDELRAAIEAGADIVMLDNFDDATLAEAVRVAAGRVLLEVSGGVTLERLPRIAASGVDVVSVGALTHSVPAADLSMLVVVGTAVEASR